MNRPRRILIVEDDTVAALGLKDLLAAEGYRIRIAENGLRALTLASSFGPDMVLPDVNLPRLSGLEVCRRLRTDGYRGLLFMLSARSDQADKMLGLESGADDYAPKPFDTREVLARVRAHFRELDRLRVHLPAASTTREPTRRLVAIMFIVVYSISL